MPDYLCKISKFFLNVEIALDFFFLFVLRLEWKKKTSGTGSTYITNTLK